MSWLFQLKKVLMYITAVFKVIYHEPLELQELKLTEVPVLKLDADTGKILGSGISKRQNIFVTWKNTESEIFWEFHLPTKGIFNINIAYSNIKNIARTKLLLNVGDDKKNQSFEVYTEYSGGWNSIKIFEIGSVTIKQAGEYRLVLRAIEMQGRQACDLHYVTISGPFQELTPTEIPELKLNADTGKILGPGISKREDIFVTWKSAESEIFWDFHLPSKGFINIDIAYSNIRSISKTKLLLKFGNNAKNQSLEGYTEYSGGWHSIKILEMGSVTINQTGKYRLVLRAVEMQGGQACDLHYVTISGPFQELTPTEIPELKLNADTGKILGPGISKREDIFVTWKSAESEIFWDLHLPSKGFINIDIAYSNIRSISKTKLLLKFGNNAKNQSLEGYTEYSGGWHSIKILEMGSVTINQAGKYRLVLRAVEMQGGQACDLHYVTISGPGVSGGVIVDIFPSNADAVHLRFLTDEKSDMFYNEVIVDESYPKTFFMACGFFGGYFGIQDVDFNGRKRSIFSLWDVEGEALIDEDDLASVVRDGENVTVQRFGGEGTGYQSLYDFTWNIGETQRFLLTATPDGKFAIFTAFIYLPSHQQWKLMASFKKRKSYFLLDDYYSFLEDWCGKWGFLSRQASFNPWYRNGNGQWIQINKATFSRTGNNSNVNGWTRYERFYLRTGGVTINTIRPREAITRIASDQRPQQLNDIDKIITQELFIP